MAGEARRTSPRRWFVLAAVLVPVLAFVLPPLVNINRYQHRIADSLSRSIGRQVHISSVRLRVLPLPGFEFSNFSIQEDPEYGAEPILHSDSVVAYPRLSSLWRGRLEVSRIHFDDASLNLVRKANGQWNFATVLVQAAHIPNAPTGQRYAGSAPRFPYIEAENTRINFKQGAEKKPLSFLNSDLSISLNAGNEWELHFRAQPVRTDLNISMADTGTLRIDGTLRRASLLEQMPLKLNVQWSGVPLGQLSRLTMGRDAGWRGGLDVVAEVGGTAELAQLRTSLKVAGLHRSEFTAARPLDVATDCRASFRKQSRSLEDISCMSPVGEGRLQLAGSIAEVQTVPQAQLTLAIEKVPAAAVLLGLQEVRSGLGAGLQATGPLNGQFEYASRSNHPPLITGDMTVNSLSLAPPDGGKPFVLGPVRLRCESTSTAPVLLLQPVRLAMGTQSPVSVDGRFTSTGFDLHLSGGATLARLSAFRSLGWLSWLGPRAVGTAASSGATVGLGGTGTAVVDLAVRGKWLPPLPDSDEPLASSTAEGSVVLRNAELTTPYLSQPLHILSAQAILSPTQIAWTNAVVGFGKLEAQGTLEYPTVCPAALPSNRSACIGRFSLSLPALDVAALQGALLGKADRNEFLRQLLDRIDRRPAPWPDLSGTVQVGTLSAGKLVVHDAIGAIDISGNTMRIRSLNGHVANGTMHLSGGVDASGDQPQYQLNVQVTNAALAGLGTIFDERWGTGTANFSAQVHMEGFSASELVRSAAGPLHWDWTKGGLAAEDAVPPFAHFDQWSADGVIDDKSIRITHSLLARGEDAIPFSGTISFDREMDLKGGSTDHLFSVTGTFEHPEVSDVAEN